MRSRRGPRALRLALFDLDHTLLSGDSDVLWCDFLIAKGLLDAASFAVRNADIEARYRLGTVSVEEFTNFYVGTLAGRSPEQWEPLRQEFLSSQILPRLPQAAKDLVRGHQEAADLVVLTSATNRFLTELTARYLEIEHLIGTEPELEQGLFTGRTSGLLNMREGKVTRLHQWLDGVGYRLDAFHSTAYSDSINDLPLLMEVDEPVAVDPDPKLEEIATERKWRVLRLR